MPAGLRELFKARLEVEMKPIETELLHIMQHSLGLDQYGQGRQYRNYFSTGEGSTDFPKCQKLVEAGYMMDRGPIEMHGGDHCFHVTPAGVDYVALNSPKPPKLSRSKQRYAEYLSADSDWSFGEWLKRRAAKRRAEAYL